MPEKLLLDIRDIHKSFGMNAVLKGISLKLGEGEVLALIGGNGRKEYPDEDHHGNLPSGQRRDLC